MKPLQGVKVLEAAQWVAGPAAGVILAHLGADVVHVEHPVRGDGLRGLRSDVLRGIFANSGVKSDAMEKINMIWELANRGKRSFGLDMKSPDGQEVLAQLIAQADVVLTGLRPYELDAFHLRAERIHQINPKAVVVHVTGWGMSGPRADTAGYDHTCFWASTGLMTTLTRQGQEPPYPRPALGDLTSSLAAAAAVMGGLVGRQTTGKGTVAEVSLYGVGMWATASDLQTVLLTGKELVPHNRQSAHNPLANLYLTQDKRWIMLHHLQSDVYWPNVCRAIKAPELLEDSRFVDFENRRQNAVDLVAILDAAFAEHTLAYWQSTLSQHDVVWAPLRTPIEVIGDEQSRHAHGVGSVEHPELGELPFVNPPIHFRDAGNDKLTSSPELGQHTEEILVEMGFNWDQIGQLKAKQVIN